MKTRKIPVCSTLAIVLSLAMAGAATTPARGAAIWGATEWTQIANNVQLLMQFGQQVAINAKEAEQIANQVEQIRMQLEQLRIDTENFRNLTPQQWAKATADLVQLSRCIKVSQKQVFNVSTMDDLMHQRFPMYDQFLAEKNLKSDVFFQQAQGISASIEENCKSILDHADFQLNQFDDDQQALETLKSLNNNATGQMQAIQAGNNIAIMMTIEIRKLRQLSTLQSQLIAKTAKAEQLKDRQEDMNQRLMLNESDAIKATHSHFTPGK